VPQDATWNRTTPDRTRSNAVWSVGGGGLLDVVSDGDEPGAVVVPAESCAAESCTVEDEGAGGTGADVVGATGADDVGDGVGLDADVPSVPSAPQPASSTLTDAVTSARRTGMVPPPRHAPAARVDLPRTAVNGFGARPVP
jgi:hypothetical protein